MTTTADLGGPGAAPADDPCALPGTLPSHHPDHAWGANSAAIAGLYALGLAYLARPTETFTPVSVLGSVAVAAVFGVLAYAALRRQLALTALLVMLFGMAFTPSCGDALELGARSRIYGGYAPAPSVVTAIEMVLMFVAVATLVSAATTRALEDWRRGARRIPTVVETRLLHGAMLVLMGVSLADAVRTGAWSHYGSITEEQRGGFQLTYFYHPMLFSAFALGADALCRRLALVSMRLRPRSMLPVGLVLLGVFVLMFISQYRRLMIAAIILAVLLVMTHKLASRRIFGSLSRVTSAAVGLGVMVAFVTLGSNAWRASSNEFRTNNLAERMDDVAPRVVDAETHRNNESGSIEDRLTYLWTDATAVEFQPLMSRFYPADEVFWRSIVYNIPGVLFPAKYKYPYLPCEAAFSQAGVSQSDMNCTPTTEGYTFGGAWGVLGVAVFWGLAAGVADWAFRRRTVYGMVFGLHFILPLLAIEADAFPMFYSVRSSLASVAVMALIAWALRVAGPLLHPSRA